MAVKFLDKTGLGYFWGKIKAWCNSTFAAIAHTHTSYAAKHSYTTAANAAKNWYRIANANTSQTNTTKPIHAQFILTAYNTSYDAGYYERWFVNAEVFGRNAHIVILGNSSAPFSQARVLYENTIADLDANDRPAIDIYLNYVLPNGTTKIEIEEVYNQGWTFVADGQISASTVPTGFENQSCSVRGNGVERSTYSDYATYLNKPRREITANTTLADNSTYRSTTLNCTGTITITVPSLNSNYAWFFIKNANPTSGVITIHPSTTSVLIDGSNADIALQPNEYVIIHSRAANKYSIIADGRWKSQKADKATTLAGYGITDAKIANGTITLGSSSITPLTSHQTLPTLSRTISGSGNAITDITVSNHAITATKGATFLTSHQTLPTLSKTDSGSGNAVTAISVNNHAITVTKGSTFLTAASTLDATKLSGTIPSGCYTNTTYTAGTGLSLSGTKFSLASHNQASNTINAMTGYSKPNSTSAIVASDTLNQAIGKLEKAIDDADISNTVHLTGNEFIGGTKEFGNSYYDSTREGETDWESSSLIIRYQNYIKGSGAPSTNKYCNLLFLDKTGTNINWSGRLGSVENDVEPDGTHKTLLVCYKNEVIDGVAARDTAVVYVGYDSDGVKFAAAPSTSEDRTAATDILTRDWISKDTRIVHTSGFETIDGEKHFNAALVLHHPSIAKGTIPSSASYRSLAFADNTSLNGAMNHRAGLLENKIDTGGTVITYIGAYQWTSGSTNYATMGISIDRSGNASAYAPTPATSSNDNSIATTAFVKTQLNSCAKLSSKNVFSQMQVISRVNPYVILKETDIVKGNSSSGGWQGIKFFDNNYDTSTDGAGAEECGELIMSHGTTTEALYRFIVYKPTKNSTTYASFAFGYSGGSDDSTNLYFYTNVHDNKVKLGSSAHRWATVFSGTGSINTSDARLKSDISNIPDSVLDAWDKVRWCQFKMNDAVAEKGDKARIHSGAIAQEIASVFESEGLDPSRYALYCYDKWDAREEKQDSFGSIKETAWPAGDRYSLRYEEALCMEAAYQRRKNKILENRISELEKQVSDMLQILQNLTSNNG